MQRHPLPATTRELLLQQGERRGTKPAILAPGRAAISYAGLAAGVDRAGATLAELGFGRGHRVATALPDGPDTAVAMLALMTWCTCVPLNASLDKEAAAGLLQQLRVDALAAPEGDDCAVTQAALAAGLPILRLSRAPEGGEDLILLGSGSPRPAAARTAPVADDIAVVAHTSGTTARPKVVPMTQSMLLLPEGRRGVDESDRFLCITPLHTSSGFGNGILAPLRMGGSTVLCPGFDAARFFAWLDTFQPTYYSASPTVHAAIVDEVLARGITLPPSLRFVRSSSNGMAAALQEKIESVLGVPVIQGYGSTEAGLIAQDSPFPGRRRAGSVGTAAGTQIMIMGDDGEALPPRGVGEILVRGPAVMPGYENDPEANRTAFHDGWLRTGDLGHLDEDGYLYISGRVKEMINRGGLKVAPAEVDAVFLRHPAVLEAATVGVRHPSLGEDVVTAVVPRPGATITAAELRAWVLSQLAPFKVPSAVVFVRELPRNSLGKVPRSTLAASLAASLQGEFVPPRNADEALIAGIIATLLNVPAVGALDNFFAHGGDSLSAVQVLSRIAAETGIELQPAVLFEAPTVEQFALRLEAERARRAGTSHRAANTPQLVRRQHRRVGTGER